MTHRPCQTFFFASLRGQKALKNAKIHNFLHHYPIMLPHSYKYSHWQWNFWVRLHALSWIRSIVISCRIVDLSFLHYAGCISIYLWKIRWSAKSFHIENWHLNEVIDFRIKVTSAIYWLIYDIPAKEQITQGIRYSCMNGGKGSPSYGERFFALFVILKGPSSGLTPISKQVGSSYVYWSFVHPTMIWDRLHKNCAKSSAGSKCQTKRGMQNLLMV